MEGTLSERFRAELSKIKDMTLKEKADYIWEYYRIHIISTAFVLVFIGSIINTVFINPPKKSYAHLSICGAYVDSLVMERLGADISERVVDDKENYTVYTSNFYDNPNDIEMNMAVQQKFFAMISAKEIDIIIAPKEYIGGLAEEELLLDLTDIIPQLQGIPESDILFSNTLSSEETAPYGIMLHDAEVMINNDLNANGYYIGLIINSDRISNAMDVIRELLE